MIEKLPTTQYVNNFKLQDKINEIITFLSVGDTEACLSLYPRGYLIDEQVYRIRLTIPAILKFKEENDSCFMMESDIEAESDEEAIKIAQKVAGALMIRLDLEMMNL